MRELIRIAQECCRLMLVQLRQKQRRQESVDNLQIDAAILNQALVLSGINKAVFQLHNGFPL